MIAAVVCAVIVAALLLWGAARLGDRREQASPFAGWEMPPEIAHEKRVQAPEFLPAPTQTPPAGRRDAGRIPPASRWPSGAGSRPGAYQRDPAAAAQAAAAGRTHGMGPGAGLPAPVTATCAVVRTVTSPAPAEPDPFSEAYAHVRAIQALTPDEYAAQHLGRQYADDTGSFLASTTGWS